VPSGVVDVVVDLLDGLGGDRGERGLGARGERLVEPELVRREQQQPGGGDGEVLVRVLGDLQVRELPLPAQVRQVVLAAAGSLPLPGGGQQHPGLAEQVEPDVRERDVLLELRRVRDPLAAPVRQDQGVVAEREGVAGPCGGGPGRGGGAGHRCCTSAGTS
jgi:hypothetical protein